jgi:hypothetical protein
MIQDCLPDMEKIVVFPSSFHRLEIDIWTDQEEISTKSLTPQTSVFFSSMWFYVVQLIWVCKFLNGNCWILLDSAGFPTVQTA